MENKVLFKAKAANKINAIILAVLSVISIVLCVLCFIPVKKSSDIYYHHYTRYGFLQDSYREYKNIFGHDLGHYKTNIKFCDISRCDTLVYIFSIIFTVLFIIFLSLTIFSFKSRKCILELNPDGIQGKVKKLFSSKSINQPFEQIDNLYIRKNIIDIITGGKTIAISSGGSKIKFSCVANAQEFVDKTLEELKKYKESVNSKTEKVPEASSGNAMDDLLKLKSLLDQGLITQEEFDKKRNRFIEKI